jgi:EmrB/QacA subfamily drug resistance transporter
MARETAMSEGTDPNALDRDTMVVAGVVLLGAVMSILDTTVINVAIDRLAIDFNASLTTIQWVVTGYTLALAAVIPLTGWAADRFGTKRIYLWSLALFMLGSILSAAAWSAGSLIAFRVLQGAGGGMIMPAVMTIMTKKAGPHRMGRVMGILGVPMLVAPLLGPILGGWLVDDVSWRWIFLINVPIGIVAMILAQLKLERDEPQPAHKLDWLGMLLLSPGLTLLIFGLAESNGADGFAATKSWLTMVVGAGLILGFLRHSWRAEEPLIDIRTFTHTRAGAAAGTFMLFAIAFFGSLLLVPLYYQTVRGASALEAGLLLAPQGLGAMITMRWPAASPIGMARTNGPPAGSPCW